MSNFKDFVGINICIYEPTLNDSGAIGGNTLGYDPNSAFFYTDNVGIGNVGPITKAPVVKTLVLLNLHRNGPFGYPMWKQMRTSQNHLTRAQNKINTFTYVQEPGVVIGANQAKYGKIISLQEPVIAGNLPISLIGEVEIYNDVLGTFEKKPVEIKTAFNNETSFFANQEANQYFGTILETDENYETLKNMYLDGGLDDEGSLLDSFTLLTYRQSIWPKQQSAYLDKTRSRKFFVNTFWRDNREDREKNDVITGFDFTALSQSMWPLDAADDYATRITPATTTSTALVTVNHRIGGDELQNTKGGEGLLLNSYSQIGSRFYVGATPPSTPAGLLTGQPITGSLTRAGGSITLPDSVMSSSIFYSRRHTIKSTFSNFNPAFPTFNTGSTGLRYKGQLEGVGMEILTLQGSASLMLTSSLFEGVPNWDAPAQAGKTPFYDSYEDYAQETRNKGKGYSIVPEFRISSHVSDYSTKGVTQELKSIFELSGALSKNTTTENASTFYKIISNSDFLKHFDLIKKDHKGFADERIITLKCKAIKKFLPYEGFYPAQRTVQLGEQFVKSYGSNITAKETGASIDAELGSFRLQPVLTPLFAPGILFNTIKSGVGVDFPIFTADSDPFVATSSNNNYNDYWTGPSSFYSLPPEGPYQNFYWAGSGFSKTAGELRSAYDKRIPFEALVEPEEYLANLRLIIQEPHPFGMPYTGSHLSTTAQFLPYHSEWDGRGDELYKKMAHNLLAEIPEMFLQNKSFSTITSLEDQDPNFGNAVSGNYYMMRVKMKKSRQVKNQPLGGFYGEPVEPPQDVMTYQDRGISTSIDGPANTNLKARFSAKESITMYSRPSAFGPPTYGGNGFGTYRGIEFRECGSWWGTNHPYTPPYYHGEAWCDLVFNPTETRKYSLEEIMVSSSQFPYYTRHWWNGTMDALRDVTGYSGSSNTTSTGIYGPDPFDTSAITAGTYASYANGPWHNLIKESGKKITQWPAGALSLTKVLKMKDFFSANWGQNTIDAGGDNLGTVDSDTHLRYRARPNGSGSAYTIQDQLIQHPFYINENAMQLDSSVNLFGKGTVRQVFDKDTQLTSEVASSDTVRGKTRWIIQPKFETPILNFKKYEKLTENGGTLPLYASESVARGMWHQYGEIPTDPKVGVFLQVEDIPRSWLKGALGVTAQQRNIASLANLVGFSKEPVRLGQVASEKEISECVVAVPFVEKDATRKFFSIPRVDIDSCINAAKREIGGQFPAGGPPKAGDTVYEMVKKMQKYVFPPSMDFVKYEDVNPFAMYIFEFKHNLTKQDVADIWQNLPPEIGVSMEEAESSISHELLAAELLGSGAVVNNNVLDENAEGSGIPSNIQWMVFKVKKRAKTNYFDKIVAKKGTTDETSGVQLVGVTNAVTGKKDKEITYNWPYDFFSLVELVKIDAEVSFANIENDDKGQKSIKKVEKKAPLKVSPTRARVKGINIARGKGKSKK
tara:strand:- start:5767 stop:10149 length:4383 start_codon:yes stop_codon:yes gene_type:complete